MRLQYQDMAMRDEDMRLRDKDMGMREEDMRLRVKDMGSMTLFLTVYWMAISA